MTNRAINKAIAEHLGWKELDFHLDGKRILGDRPTFSNGKIVSYTVDQYVPDYCNDLNAMAEAENTLNDDQQYEYAYVLDDLIKNRSCEFNLIHASARMRAEAFVRTIGKWKE
jgi:hypothetical protein